MKRNPYLRVKLKSLAEEARIIRIEERRANKAGNYALQNSLVLHRTSIVRSEARATLLAYNYLRGLPYEACEAQGSTPPNWNKVEAMVKKYGRIYNFKPSDWVSGKCLKAAA